MKVLYEIANEFLSDKTAQFYRSSLCKVDSYCRPACLWSCIQLVRPFILTQWQDVK